MASGDALARGAKSAVFPPAKVSQERWDSIWADDKTENVKPAKKKQPKKVVWSK